MIRSVEIVPAAVEIQYIGDSHGVEGKMGVKPLKGGESSSGEVVCLQQQRQEHESRNGCIYIYIIYVYIYIYIL